MWLCDIIILDKRRKLLLCGRSKEKQPVWNYSWKAFWATVEFCSELWLSNILQLMRFHHRGWENWENLFISFSSCAETDYKMVVFILFSKAVPPIWSLKFCNKLCQNSYGKLLDEPLKGVIYPGFTLRKSNSKLNP